MSNETTKPQWSGQGVVQSFVSLKEGSSHSQAELEKWIEEVYVSAIMATGAGATASTFKAADPAYGKQHMILCEIPDLTRIKEQDLVENTFLGKDLGTSEGSVGGDLEIGARILVMEEHFETKKHPKNVATAVLYAGMQPAPGGEADLDAWYREEHNEQMSKEPGWKRTIRYRLLAQSQKDEKKPDGLDFLAIHEFGEGNQLGKEVKPLEPITDWTRKAMSECKAIDAAIYHKVSDSASSF